MKPYAESAINRIAAIIRAASERWTPVQWRRFADRIEQGDYTDEAMAERVEWSPAALETWLKRALLEWDRQGAAIRMVQAYLGMEG